MTSWSLEREYRSLESSISNPELDFSARFMASTSLHTLIQEDPAFPCVETIDALERLLKDPGPNSETRGLFLYKEAAGALALIAVKNREGTLGAAALSSLKDAMYTCSSASHRAVTEALGSLPLRIEGPELPAVPPCPVSPVSWEELCHKVPYGIREPALTMGRSLILPLEDSERVMVLKLFRETEEADALEMEAIWQSFLGENALSSRVRFDLPVPVKIQDRYAFYLEDPPPGASTIPGISARPGAVCFIVHKDYFRYPNDHDPRKRPSGKEFIGIMGRNAWLLGRLASEGIVHTAPIPLFHNRVQRARRADNGLYEWWRGGRLDRWLDSCAYPNLGPTGIRDFEHFISFEGPSLHLYRHIGTHLLGLLLVAGSYFRNASPGRRGFNPEGKPVDARDLFDPDLFSRVLEEIFHSFYRGFTGRDLQRLPIDLDMLVGRMIEEMGVDRHMEEILRVVDQENMTQEDFRSFLLERGYTKKDISSLEKGKEEITIYTGPHLGGFNQRISLPEMIEAIGAMSALCIAERWESSFSLPVFPSQEGDSLATSR